MALNKKTVLPPAIIFAMFAAAIFSLLFSGLSLSKAISIQNELTAVFFKSMQISAVSAAADSVVFIFLNAVLPLLPFLVFSVLGFSAVLWFKPGTRNLAAALAAVEVAVLAPIAAGMSPALLVIPLGYFALLLPIEFEEKKTAFKTGQAFSSNMLRYLNIAAAIAVFLAILSLPNFDKVSEQQMISGVNMLLPDMRQIQQAQNEVANTFINQAYSDVKGIVQDNYKALPSGRQAECSEFKDSISSEIDTYKSRLQSQLQSGNSTAGTEQLVQQVFSKIGILSAMAKALPLLAAVSLFVLLELLKPLLALAGGTAYSLLNRKTGR